jgi:hypothetical protein
MFFPLSSFAGEGLGEGPSFFPNKPSHFKDTQEAPAWAVSLDRPA